MPDRNQNCTTEATNWTEYYAKPKSWFSTFTQRFTLEKLLKYLDNLSAPQIDILELGGGNSCFAQQIIENKRGGVQTYSIVDNCKFAVDQFKAQGLPGQAILANLTADGVLDEIRHKYDFVYSVGLIEHFRGNDIKKLIKVHFDMCKEGGTVLISVPTPSVQYKVIRKAMELFHVWEFPDEKPLRYEEISPVIGQYGKVTAHEINYKLPLTQLLIVAEKHIDSDQ